MSSLENCLLKIGVYTYNEIISLKKGGNHATYNKINDLKDIMLNEVNQSQKDNYYMIPLMLYLKQPNAWVQRVESWLIGDGAMVSCCSIGVMFQIRRVNKF